LSASRTCGAKRSCPSDGNKKEGLVVAVVESLLQSFFSDDVCGGAFDDISRDGESCCSGLSSVSDASDRSIESSVREIPKDN